MADTFDRAASFGATRPYDVEVSRIRARTALENAPGPSLVEQAGAAVNSEWLLSHMFRQYGRSGYYADPDFPGVFSSRELADELTEGLSPDMFEAFNDAVSLDHAYKIREQLLSVQSSREILQRGGITGTVLLVGANILDPAQLAIDAAAVSALGPLGVASSRGVRGGRVVRAMLRTGVSAAASEAAIQAYISSQDPTQDAEDVAYAALGGFVLGSAADVGLSKLYDAHIAKQQRRLEAQGVGRVLGMGAADPSINVPDIFYYADEQALQEISRVDGAVAFRTLTSDDAKREFIRDTKRRLGIEPLDGESLEDLPPEAYLGRPFISKDDISGIASGESAPVSGGIGRGADEGGNGLDGLPPSEMGDWIPQSSDSTSLGRPGGLMVRFGTAARGGQSKSARIRRATSVLVQELLLRRADGSTAGIAAETAQRIKSRGLMARFRAGHGSAFNKFATDPANRAADGKSVGNIRERFNVLVGRAVRAPRGTYPALDEAANVVREINADIAKWLNRMGAIGFEDDLTNDLYLRRQRSIRRATQIGRRYDKDTQLDMWQGAFISANPDLDPDIARKAGAVMLRQLNDDGTFDDFQVVNAFYGRDRNALVRLIMDADAGTSPDEAVRIAESLYRERTGVGPGFSKSRATFDENYVDTNTGLSPLHYYEEDVEAIMTRYVHQATGYGVTQRALRHLEVEWGLERGSLRDWNDLRRAAVADVGEENLTFWDKTVLNELETQFNIISGRRVVPNTLTNRVFSNSRKVAAAMYNGMFGAAALADLVIPLGDFTASTVRVFMPTLGTMFRRNKANGLPVDAAQRNLEHLGIVITDAHYGNPMGKITGLDNDLQPTHWIERLIDRANRFSFTVSGLNLVDGITKNVAARAAEDAIVRTALSGKKLSARKLGLLGMSDADWELVSSVIREGRKSGAVFRPEGFFQTWLVDHGRLSDPHAASKMLHGMGFYAQRAAGDPALGSRFGFMDTELGKTMLQFRSFGINAYESQFLSRVYNFDANAAFGFVVMTIGAGIAYGIQRRFETIGMSEQEREKFLQDTGADTVESMLVSGFVRSAYANMLPGVYDSLAAAVGAQQQFGNYRSSGLPSNFIGGSPVVGLADSFVRGTGEIGEDVFSLIDGDSEAHFLSKDNIDRGVGAIVPRKMIGVQQLMNYLNSVAPEERE